jgi:CHAT domain-containing protein
MALTVWVHREAVTAQRPELPLLKLDSPVTRTLSSAQEHLYRINLSKGEAVRIEVEQRGVDVAVSATIGEGAPFARVNLQNHGKGVEPLYLITEAGAEVRVKVSGVSRNGGAGQYIIRLAERRNTTEDDRQIFKAQTLASEAFRLGSQSEVNVRQQAWAYYEQALLICQNLKADSWRAALLLQMGQLALDLNNFQEARDYFSRASKLGFNLEDRDLENLGRQGLCRIHNVLGEHAQEIKCLDALAGYYKANEKKQDQATLLMNKARALRMQKQSGPALSPVQEVIPLLHALEDKLGEADAYEFLGQLFLDLRDQRKALEAFDACLILRRALKDKPAELSLLYRIGQLELALGDHKEARGDFAEALKLAQDLGDNNIQAALQKYFGELFYAEGNYQKALDSFRVGQRLARFYTSPEAESRVLLDFARTSLQLNQTADVAPALQRAGELVKLQGDRMAQMTVLLLQSRLTLQMKDHAGARLTAQQAYALAREIGHYPSEREALLTSARAARDLGDITGALKDSEAAYALSESPRAKAYEAEMRGKARRNDHELYLDLLMQENTRNLQAGYGSLAFQLNERMRTNNLLAVLTAAQVDFSTWADPDLLRRERELVANIKQLEGERTVALEQRQPLMRVTELTRKVESLTGQLSRVQKELATNHPRYAALAQPKLVSLAEVQQSLDADTTLLEYALGTESSTLWLINSAGAKSFTLPGRAAIETLAQRAILASSTPANAKGSELALRELSNVLLGQAAGQMRSTRLFIVPDGILHYVPFAALYEDKTRTLNNRREIAYLPAAYVLQYLNGLPPLTRTAGRDLVVVSDPVLLASDARVGAGFRSDKNIFPKPLANMADDANLKDFTRRALTRRSLRIGWDNLSKDLSFRAFDFNASRANLAQGHFGDFYALHLDVPVIINAQQPELSGFALSLVNPEGQPLPGYISLTELYQLNLSTYLVSLPSTRTALGAAPQAEALIGFTRGFMYAGARNMLTCLWEVDTESTAEFMRVFYENLLRAKLSPPAALHAAQAVMRKSPRWAAPHYWAGFVVEGTWRQ